MPIQSMFNHNHLYDFINYYNCVYHNQCYDSTDYDDYYDPNNFYIVYYFNSFGDDYDNWRRRWWRWGWRRQWNKWRR